MDVCLGRPIPAQACSQQLTETCSFGAPQSSLPAFPPADSDEQCFSQVGNCIGQGNRHLFLAFLWVELVAMVMVAGTAALRLHHIARRWGPATSDAVPWAVGFIIVDIIVLGSVAALAITQVCCHHVVSDGPA